MKLEDYMERQSLETSVECSEGLSMSSYERDYLQEAINCGDKDLLVARIDELGDAKPPKAIDSSCEVKELLEESGQELAAQYLEAPSDLEQVRQVSEALHNIEGADFETYRTLSADKRLEVFQAIENKVAEIAHRPACTINMESLGRNCWGRFNPETKEITLNFNKLLLWDNATYIQCLNTIVHEGRHAYQDYNLTERQVHCSSGDITNWRFNKEKLGYMPPQVFGYRLYRAQPLEADANKFAEDVIQKFKES